MQQQQEPVQPFGITLIAALTAVVPLAILLRGEARSINFLSAVVGVTAGSGLFLEKPWGRWLTILFYVYASISILIVWHASLPAFLATVLPVLIIVYLFLPGIRAVFEPKTP